MLVYSNDGYRVLFQGTKIVLNNIQMHSHSHSLIHNFFFSLQVIIFIYDIYMFSLIFKITINFKTNTIFTQCSP